MPLASRAGVVLLASLALVGCSSQGSSAPAQATTAPAASAAAPVASAVASSSSTVPADVQAARKNISNALVTFMAELDAQWIALSDRQRQDSCVALNESLQKSAEAATKQFIEALNDATRQDLEKSGATADALERVFAKYIQGRCERVTEKQ